MADEIKFRWSDSGAASFELLPMLEPSFAASPSVDLVKGVENVDVPIAVENIVSGATVPVRVELLIRLASGGSYSVQINEANLHWTKAGLAALGTGSTRKLRLDLETSKVYGTGVVDLVISSPRFANGPITKTAWAKLSRAFKLEVSGAPSIDLAVALKDERAFASLQIGTPLQFKFTQLPDELKAAKLQVGCKFGAGASCVAVGTESWSQILSVGIVGGTLDLGLAGKNGCQGTFLIEKVTVGKNNKTFTSNVAKINLAESIPVPSLDHFVLEDASFFSAAFDPTLYSKSWKMGCPLWHLDAAFSGIHAESNFHLDLAAIHSPDGGLYELEFLRFSSPDLMDVAIPMTETGAQWTRKVYFQGGKASANVVASFLRPDGLSGVVAENPIGLILCQAKESTKSKAGEIPLTFAKALTGFGHGKAVLPKKILRERTMVQACNASAADALGSNLLNLVEGVTQWTPYPKTIDEALALQMALPGKQAPAVKEGTPASKAQVKEKMDATTRWSDPIGQFEFVRIDRTFTVPDEKLNAWFETYSKKLEKGKIFHLLGTGAAFNKAAKDNSLNVAYCVGHCLAETGGTAISFKADDGNVYYNAFGIGAFDGSAYTGAAATAKAQGWVTPQKAIEGGLRWIAQVFMKKSGISLNTPYKLRWNPDNPANSQYCTGIVWCGNIASLAQQVASLAPASTHGDLLFDFPLYKNQTKPE
jgi:beta-N-acetylglucosaminidase